MKSLVSYFQRISVSSLRPTEEDNSNKTTIETVISDKINISNECDPALTDIKEFNNNLRPLRPAITKYPATDKA